MQVKTEYIKRKGFMTVDGQESPSVTVVGNATTLDVEGKLYLGGLPVHYRARSIGTVSSGPLRGTHVTLLWLWFCRRLSFTDTLVYLS